MKLAKLSLAAIMAVGALSTVNATPLEDAIKGVDLSGFTRYRYYNRDSVAHDLANDNERHRFSASATLTSPVAENLVASITADIDLNNLAADGAEAGQDLRVQQLWFKYSNENYSFKLGKQALNTPVTYNYFSVATGNGARFMYTGVKNFTFAAAAFVDSDRNFALTAAQNAENLYAVAAIGSFGSVNAQLWAFKMTNIIDDEEFLQVDGKVAGFSYKAQYVRANLDSAISTETQSFYGVQLGYKMDSFGIKGGYTGTSSKGGFVSLAGGDGSGFISGGINSVYEISNQADVSSLFVSVGASFGKVSVGAGYVDDSYTAGGLNVDVSEAYAKVGYKYSKNFNTSVYYSSLGQDVDSNEFRFEAKYSF